MDALAPKFLAIERLYNATVKTAFKLPAKGSKECVNSLLGAFNMRHIVLRSYGANALKWQRAYRHDLYTHKCDIGFAMDCNLDSILKQLGLTRKKMANSEAFGKQVQFNGYGHAGWSPIGEVKNSDDIIKLVQWQAKARQMRYGQYQLCKFCSQSRGTWSHYATCAQRPKQLTDLEALIYFQASVRLDELLLDTGCKDWVDKLYDQMPPFQLRRTISASLSLVKAYFKQLEFLLFSRKQKKQAAREGIKLKQLEIGHFFQRAPGKQRENTQNKIKSNEREQI